MLDLGVLIGGGITPSAGMAEVKMKELSPALDIILPTGTPIQVDQKDEPGRSLDRLSQSRVY